MHCNGADDFSEFNASFLEINAQFYSSFNQYFKTIIVRICLDNPLLMN